MKQVCIVGVGLIGGSLGMALRKVRVKNQRQYFVFGIGRTKESLRQAKRRGALDEFFTSPVEAVSNSDIVVLCVPVHVMAKTTQSLLPFLKKGAIVTDVGSVKDDVEKSVRKILSVRKDVRFVGAHPLAGSEKSGIEHANAHLFKGAKVVMTGQHPLIRKMWTDVGACSLYLSSQDHDQILSLTSHLPHLMAFALFQQALELVRRRPVAKSLVAGSFRDMTRIAGSDPDVWSGIFQKNQQAIKSTTKEFTRNLQRLLTASSPKLISFLKAISESKKSW